MQKGSAQEDEEMQVIGNHQSRGGGRGQGSKGENAMKLVLRGGVWLGRCRMEENGNHGRSRKEMLLILFVYLGYGIACSDGSSQHVPL